ncbi:hypothetical protein KIL84_013988 [Mauremys mutica]|uniref:Uncharacterized protein n=1 Tax=Mauremys mutica TaxID=74926 RepID=A0A9D3WYY9_9SAUR|nr:hypothetical protein KIL84_013988 [Mauremys mutica]
MPHWFQALLAQPLPPHLLLSAPSKAHVHPLLCLLRSCPIAALGQCPTPRVCNSFPASHCHCPVTPTLCTAEMVWVSYRPGPDHSHFSRNVNRKQGCRREPAFTCTLIRGVRLWGTAVNRAACQAHSLNSAIFQGTEGRIAVTKSHCNNKDSSAREN